MFMRPAFALCATLLMLAGCNKGTEQPAAKAASAQVLPATVSDAMLNLDRSHAQPLLQPPPRAVVTDSDSPSDAPSDAAAPAEAAPAAQSAPAN